MNIEDEINDLNRLAQSARVTMGALQGVLTVLGEIKATVTAMREAGMLETVPDGENKARVEVSVGGGMVVPKDHQPTIMPCASKAAGEDAK